MGTISHEIAIKKAHQEYDLYKDRIKNEVTNVELDFLKQIENTTKKIKK